MRSRIFILLLSFFSTTMAYAQNAHGLFTEILQAYVTNGKVNYRELCKDHRLEEYLAQLAATNPDTIADRDAQLAFWLNAYNAYTLKVICDNYPLKSINQLHWGGLYIGVILNKTVWDKDFFSINNKKMSLNHIEHEIVRAKYKDPRAHFALVCASISCPPLRSEAFEGYKLNQQLDDQGRIFFSETEKNYFEADKKKAHLSKILDWYEDDFGENDEEVLLYVARFLPEDVATSIRANPKEWDISYTHYDWSLNE